MMRFLVKSIAVTAMALMMFASGTSAQWMKDPAKVDLSAPAPKANDGKIDLSGVWLPDIDPNGSRRNVENMPFSPYFANIAADLKQDDPLQPWARTLLQERRQNNSKDSPAAHCKPSGVPMVNSVPLPYKIIQMPELIVILYEENAVFRQIFLNGRRPVKDPDPRWMGYSTGKWEGDTLVVDTTGFNDQSWLDAGGHPHSENLHVIERFRRTNTGHLEIQVTVDDPKAYTKTITYTQKATLQAGEELLEYFCSENEKDERFLK
jgi:hypothetical protein